jgi:ATP-dependent helicase/nuclease subunit B
MLTIAGEGFRLSGRADRIDLMKDGTVRIIDYKTGTVPTLAQVEEGYAPQLPLEAALVERGVFRPVPEAKASELLYVRLSGGEVAGELRPIDLADIPSFATHQLETLMTKVARLNAGAEAYIPRRAPFMESDISDYDHLSRYAEWERS